MGVGFLPEVFFPVSPAPFHKGEQSELCLLFRMVTNKSASHILRVIQLSMGNKMIKPNTQTQDSKDLMDLGEIH